MNTKQMTDAELLMASIQPGNRVTINVPAGIGRHGIEYKQKTGRAILRGPAGWVLDMGGKYDRPGVATVENTVSISKVNFSSNRYANP